MTAEDVIALEPREMERAYLEYRRACYHALHRHAEQRGLLKALHQPASLEQLSGRMAFATSQRTTLALLMRALQRAGSVEALDDRGDVYVARPMEDPPPDRDRVVAAIGVDALEELVHGDSYPGIVDALFDDSNRVAAAFIADNLPLWDEFLSMPFYRYNRLKAVEQIVPAGGRLVDIACGPGFGLTELADRAGEATTVHGLEISCDFAAEAIRRTAHLGNVVVSRCDVNADGLRFVRDGAFDGAMMVGAFHFLTEPARFLHELRRALAADAPLCLSYVYMKRGSYDQALTDLRFHLREPAPHPRTESELLALATGSGFVLESSYTMGCYQSFVFRVT